MQTVNIANSEHSIYKKPLGYVTKRHELKNPSKANLLKGKIKREDVFTNAFLDFLCSINNVTKGLQTQDFYLEKQVPGYGVADIVEVVKIATPVNNKISVKAFEIKMKDWKKALSQAYRYRYYSNQVIVVLPLDKLSAPLNYLETFKKLKVGLWGFDPEKGKLKKVFSPRASRPIGKVIPDFTSF